MSMAVIAINITTVVKNICHPVTVNINVGRAKMVTATAAITNAIEFPVFAILFSPYPIHLPDFLSYYLSGFPIPTI
jgi:hypothetical protein